MKPLRVAAAEVIHKVAHEGRSLSQLLGPAQQQVADTDRAALQDLCFGTCRQWFRLQAELRQRLHKPLRGQGRVIEALLIVALYQLRRGSNAEHAVLNESVEACRVLGMPHLSGVVNAVLRAATRDGEPVSDDPAVQYAHPAWMVAKLSQNWPDHWRTILDANNQHPPMTLRVNPAFGSREHWQDVLHNAGIASEATPHAPWGLRLHQPCAVERLPGFAEGALSVQDEAAQLCTTLLDLQPGQRVLDACAAPGGKTCAIAEAEPGLSHLLALDSDTERLPRIHANLQRLGLKAQVMAADAGTPEHWWDGQAFDRILLDAPCSGSGVIRRHPDIKLLRRETDISALADTQLRLLQALWPLLAPGGRLVYATCSVFVQENARIIARFLRTQDNAQVWQPTVAWGMVSGDGRQLFPQPEGHDGFFYACLDKPVDSLDHRVCAS